MALTEESVVDSITVKEDGSIEVRQRIKIFRDGIEVAKSYHRKVVRLEDDVTLEDALVQKISATVVKHKKGK